MEQRSTDMADVDITPEDVLTISGMIGYCGGVPSGLKIHPDQQHIIYPVGCTVVSRDLSTHAQTFFNGHTNNVTCIAVSKSGKYLASGQLTHQGFMADVIIWDFSQKDNPDARMHARLTLHKTKVQALAFSPNDKFLVTLGGEDDGCVVVWNIETKQAICGSPAQVKSAGCTFTVAYANCNDYIFATGGNGTLRKWKLDVENRKIWPDEIHMGQLKRIIKCIEINATDTHFYCGTTTGDIMVVNIEGQNHIFQKLGPKNDLFSQGVTSICIVNGKEGSLLVGTGDGTVALVSECSKNGFRRKKVMQVKGAVSSLTLRGRGHQFFAGTDQCNIYRFNFADFKCELTSTCHYATINDIAFAYGYDQLLVTCSFQDVRIWDLEKCVELVRITVPNMTCNAVEVPRDGNSIITGWDDGRIRAFAPESGKLLYCINDAHKGGVTALAIYNASTSNETRIISGGKSGDVRVWQASKKVGPKGQMYVSTLEFDLKEHKASVSSIKIKKNDEECITSSLDGSCIVWDLLGRCRRQMVRVNTLFKYVCYHPAEYQYLTTGTDHKVGYWETIDGSAVRELEGAKNDAINCIDIDVSGTHFVTAGNDRLVKVWKYEEGQVCNLGIGHSAPITRVMVSPNARYVVSVSEDGCIIKWNFPNSHNI